jgi:hypothetical protein
MSAHANGSQPVGARARRARDLARRHGRTRAALEQLRATIPDRAEMPSAREATNLERRAAGARAVLFSRRPNL